MRRTIGSRAFRTVWLGHSVSGVGAGLTGFALAVWAYQRTSSSTQFALIATCSVLPGLVLSPLAGALIDRIQLRTALLVGHGGAALGAVALAALLATDSLEVWHLYIVTTATSVLGSLQWPAFSAVTTLFVPPEQLGRASGLAQLGDSAAHLLAPALGGTLLGLVGLEGVVLVELLGAMVALAAFGVSAFPQRPRPAAPQSTSFVHDVVAGGSYLAERRGLLGLLGLSCILNAAVSFLEVLSAPIVLAVASSAVLGAVRSVAGAGMVAGSLVMSLWGGPRDRMLGVLVFQVAFGAFLFAMGAATAPWLMALIGFCGLFCIPLISGCGQAIWQSQVDERFQGRVFALRQLAGLFRPLGYLVAGPLADRVFEPLVLLMVVGAATIAGTLLACRYPPLRGVERAGIVAGAAP